MAVSSYWAVRSTTDNKVRPAQQKDWTPPVSHDTSVLVLLTLEASSPNPSPLSLSFSGQEESGESAPTNNIHYITSSIRSLQSSSPLSDQTLSSTELMAEVGRVKCLPSSGLEKLQLTLSVGRETSRQAGVERVELSCSLSGLRWACCGCLTVWPDWWCPAAAWEPSDTGRGEPALLSWLITQL